jgi:hypothetical protein
MPDSSLQVWRPASNRISAVFTGSTSSDEQEVSVAEGSDHDVELMVKTVPAASLQTGTIQGTVAKPDGNPAPGAAIVIQQGGIDKFTTTTNENGKYKVENVLVREYEIKASLSPHAASELATVRVTLGGQHTVDPKLR